jgi:hypothetical protein
MNRGETRAICPRLPSAEELDFRIPRNHRASDDQCNDHKNEFHVASRSNSQHQAYALPQIKQGY